MPHSVSRAPTDRTSYRLAHAELRARLRWVTAMVAVDTEHGGVSDETKMQVARGLADALVFMEEEMDVLQRERELRGAAPLPNSSVREAVRQKLRNWLYAKGRAWM